MYNWNLLIITHAITASLAVILGAFNLFIRKPKGDLFHKTVGYIWIICMAYVSISSFWIRGLTGSFSWLHILSIITLISISAAVYFALKRNIRQHRNFVRGAYYGLIGALIGVIVVPTRRIPVLASTDPALFGVITMAIFFLGVLIIKLSYSFSRIYKKGS